MNAQIRADIVIESSFLTRSPQTSVEDAIAAMAEARSSCVLVVDNGYLAGIFTERDVVRVVSCRMPLLGITLADLMIRQLITVRYSDVDDVFSVSQLFKQHRIRHLPVLDEQGKLIGIITPQSLRNLLKPEYMLRYIRVGEVMSQAVICALPHDSLQELTQRMALHRVSCVVIITPDTFKPMGIVTERDIVRFQASRVDRDAVIAATAMSTPLSTVEPKDSLWHVHQKMQELKVRRLVVVNADTELAGIVTQTQMLKAIDPAEMYLVMEQMQETINKQTIELQRLNHELQASNEKLQHLVHIDGLTNISNRRYFDERLHQEWQKSLHSGQNLSLILGDVDEFKQFNDLYGHPAGDRCLARVAQALCLSASRPTDLIARYGGEEFALLLADTNSLGAVCVAERILAQVQQLQIPHQASSIGKYITISLGVATVIPAQEASQTVLLEVADRLLYQAKRQGRNTYSVLDCNTVFWSTNFVLEQDALQ